MRLQPDAPQTLGRIAAFAVTMIAMFVGVNAWVMLVLRSGEGLVREDAAWMGVLVWAALGVVPWGAAAAVAIGAGLGGVAKLPGWGQAGWFGALVGLGYAPLVIGGGRGDRFPLAESADRLREGAGEVQAWTTVAAIVGCTLLLLIRPLAQVLLESLSAGWYGGTSDSGRRPHGRLARTGMPLVAFHLAGLPLAVATALLVAWLDQ